MDPGTTQRNSKDYTSNMAEHNLDSQQASRLIFAAISKTLKPVVRLLLHYGIGYPQLIALLKRLYVRAAEEELNTVDKRVSDSRITLLTGVHRKDVARLRKESPEIQQEIAEGYSQDNPSDSPNDNTASLGARLVAEWMANPRFLQEEREDNPPAPLPFRDPEKRGRADFCELVETVCRKDIRPRSVLDEWQRLGIVSVSDDIISLNTEAFAPKAGLAEKAYFFGRNIQDHVEAGASNLRGSAPPFFDRSVFYDQLSRDSVEELRALSALGASELLTKINARAHSLQMKDIANKTDSAQFRFNLGIFNYSTAQSQPEEATCEE